ncbi:MAG: HoxN/HupN/NixA family nickel/cobalt transporter, partial [Candidatus Dormibacterales bacterium]
MAASAAKAVESRSGAGGALSRRDWATFGGMGAVVLGLHVLGWGIFAILVLPGHFKALGVGVAVLAYTLGNRHAFDADHISAIDNTTRKF